MSRHMKRLTAPRAWPVKRKAAVWVTKQSPGAHSKERSVPAVLVLRDMLGMCDTAREAKRIVANRDILVDGKALKDAKAPVGLMDVVSVPKADAHYRMLLTPKGKLTLEAITKEEAAWKLCRIENKVLVKGGKMQLNLHDGKNILIDENAYSTGDVLKIEVVGQKILGSYPLKEGAPILICSGKHAGSAATISEYMETNIQYENVVKFTDGSETVKRNVFVIGAKAPAVKLPEAV